MESLSFSTEKRETAIENAFFKLFKSIGISVNKNKENWFEELKPMLKSKGYKVMMASNFIYEGEERLCLVDETMKHIASVKIVY